MPTPYERIYANILPKFKSYDIPMMDPDEVKEMLRDYLTPATVKFYVCKKDLSDRDDSLEQFNEELSDTEVDIIGNYLVLEYIDSNYIRVPTVLKATLSSSDFNAFSPANLLDKMILMHTTFLSENETLLSRYSWMNKWEELQKKREAGASSWIV